MAGNATPSEETSTSTQPPERETNVNLEPDTKPPWEPRVFWPLAILAGFGAAGILAGINYRRLGRPERTWPTIVIAVGAFIALLVALSFVAVEQNNAWLAYAINVPAAMLLERLQRDDYTRWKERFPSAGRAGWGIPTMIGAGFVAVVLAVIFVPVLLLDDLSEAERLSNNGAELAEQGRWEEAITEFDKAIELDPELAETYNNRGIAHASLGNSQQAIADLDKAIGLDSGDARPYFVRGLVYADLGDNEQAIADLEQALSLTSDPELSAQATLLLIELRGQ